MRRLPRTGVAVALLLGASACSWIFPLRASDSGGRDSGIDVDSGARLDASVEAGGTGPDGGDAGECGDCGPDEECIEGVCTACGGLDEVCCPGSECGPSLSCVASSCAPCGANGDACCPGDSCELGLECAPDEDICRPALCGGPGQECCDGSPLCQLGTCDGDACPECGRLGEPCCEAGGCGNGLACEVDGLCGTCGNSACDGDEDCLSCSEDCACPGLQECLLGRCLEPTCDDDRRNGLETDVDCGGPTCDGCRDGEHCLEDGDCAEGRFEQGCRDLWHVQNRSVTHVCQDGTCVREDGPWEDGLVCGNEDVDPACGNGCSSCQRWHHYDGATCAPGEGCRGDVMSEDLCIVECGCGNCCF